MFLELLKHAKVIDKIEIKRNLNNNVLTKYSELLRDGIMEWHRNKRLVR
jgi:hypothetical protein